MKCWHVRLLHSTVSGICIWYMYTKQRILTFKKWSPSMYPRKIESHIIVLDVPSKQCHKVGPGVVVRTAVFHARVRDSVRISNFCVWRTVSSHSSDHSQEVLLAQFSLYVHKGGLKPDSFHFFYLVNPRCRACINAGRASLTMGQHWNSIPLPLTPSVSSLAER